MDAATQQARTMPSNDRRWKLVDNTMRRHGYVPNALIETLHIAQEAFAFLDDDTLRFVATSLNLPLSKVFGVATFYHHFTLKPQGKHTCVVCMGTACYIKGAAELLQTLEETYGVKPGETTKDRQLSVLQARCIGACGIAPAVVYDGEIAGKVTKEQMLSRVTQMVAQETKQVEHVA